MKKIFKFIASFIENYLVFIVLALFFVFFTGHSMLTHYSFNSHSWDLGIYAQQTWLYSQFAGFYNTVRGTNLLSDHFGIILYLFAPFYRAIPKAETILVIQALLVVASGYPLYLTAKKLLKSGLAGSVIVFAYLSSSGIRQAIDFDFHLATVAVFFYAFFLYFWLNKKYIWSIIFAILAMLCKEDVPLFIAFTALGLLAQDIKNKHDFRQSLALLVGSFASFLAIMKIMLTIPGTGANFNYFSFSYLGSNYGDVLKNFIHHPVSIIKKVWDGFIENGLKVSTFKTYLTGFWYLPLLSIDIMIFAIPFFITKFVSDRQPQWGLNGQYAMIGMYLLALATAYTIFRITQHFKKWRTPIVIAWSLVFFIFTFNYNFLMVGREFWDSYNTQRWQATKQYDGLQEIIKKIPADASVGAQEQVVSHVASRKEVYVLRCPYCLVPNEKDFDYILLDDRFGLGFAGPSREDIQSVLSKHIAQFKGDAEHNFEIVAEDKSEDHNTYLLKNTRK
jgi:uncharacterized membrane protein